MIAIARGGVLAIPVVTSRHERLSPWYSGYGLAREIRTHFVNGLWLYTVRIFDQTLPLYTKRTPILVAFRD